MRMVDFLTAGWFIIDLGNVMLPTFEGQYAASGSADSLDGVFSVQVP